MQSYSTEQNRLQLAPCHYGLSKVPMRGPQRPTDGPYVAFLGGAHTFAKHVEAPFPDLVEDALGLVCVNLGCPSAGPDVFLFDTALGAICHDAALTVIQVPGATNLSNRFYKVHPRRNDRFIAPKPALSRLFPEVDFAEIAFTGHLIQTLRDVDEDRFAAVAEVLQATWMRRMKTLVGQCTGPVVLTRLTAKDQADETAAFDAALVTSSMMEGLKACATKVLDLEVETDTPAGLFFGPMEKPFLRPHMGTAAHQKTADALTPVLKHLLS